jgi:RHS repeat-associated protein
LVINQFTYVIYDNLVRAVESGLAKNTNSVGFILQTLQSDTYTDDWAFPRNSSHFTTEQISWTYYDDITGVPTNLQTELNTIFPNGQQQTRGRVVMTSSSYTGDEQNPDAISAYTYDILGNVPELYRYDRLTERWHHFEYDFDMITSNVNEMVYQRDELDEIGYRYFYDADNRLTKSQSSTDGYIWATEEKLFYYVSGMLSRKELGEDKVQGLDYAYTINGWYKGVNAVTLDENMDMGRDGLKTDDATYDTYIYSDDLNANVSRDAFGFSLHFFNDDYKAIGRANATTNQTSFLTNLPSGHSNNLYNGNIGDMVVGLTKPQQAGQAQEAMAPQWTSYRYDQLQRIRSMQSSTTLVFNGGSEHRDEHNWGALGNGYQTNYTYDGNGNILSLLRKNAAGTTIDDLTYFYAASTGATPQGTTTPGQFINNQLLHVNDGTGSTVVDYDIDNQGNNNYKYDNIGNLIKDVAEEIYDIKWRQDGKMHEVIRTAGSQKPNLEFMYDEGGTRIAKIVKPTGSTTWTYTHYVRDVSGNVIATYEQEKIATDPVILTLKEQTIYGSKRLGIIKQNIDVSRAQVQPTGIVEKAWNRERGRKNYELANHLGNVLNGVSDLKIRIGDGSGNVLYYEADVHFASDYYPFGMQMKERTFAAQEYTYGFNGQEQDGELMDGAVVFKYRIHDPRIGKFLSVDPLAPEYPWYTPYQFAGNEVISHIELEGAEPLGSIEDPDHANTNVAHNIVEVTVTASEQTGEIKEVKYAHQEYKYWGPVSWGYTSSPYNLWVGLPLLSPGYQGYVYDEEDLKMRYSIYAPAGNMGDWDAITWSLFKLEATGVFNPLTGHNYFMTYGHTLGNLILMEDYITSAADLAGGAQGGRIGPRLHASNRKFGFVGVKSSSPFSGYKPGDNTVFSGVVNTKTGKLNYAASGNTKTARGNTPDNLVGRNRGHHEVLMSIKGSYAEHVGVTMFYKGSNHIHLEFKSGSVTSRYNRIHGNGRKKPNALPKEQQIIINAVQSSFPNAKITY